MPAFALRAPASPGSYRERAERTKLSTPQFALGPELKLATAYPGKCGGSIPSLPMKVLPLNVALLDSLPRTNGQGQVDEDTGPPLPSAALNVNCAVFVITKPDCVLSSAVLYSIVRSEWRKNLRCRCGNVVDQLHSARGGEERPLPESKPGKML